MGFRVRGIASPINGGTFYLGINTATQAASDPLVVNVSRQGGSAGAVAVDVYMAGNGGTVSPSPQTVTFADGEIGAKQVTATLNWGATDGLVTIYISNPRSTSGGPEPTIGGPAIYSRAVDSGDQPPIQSQAIPDFIYESGVASGDSIDLTTIFTGRAGLPLEFDLPAGQPTLPPGVTIAISGDNLNRSFDGRAFGAAVEVGGNTVRATDSTAAPPPSAIDIAVPLIDDGSGAGRLVTLGVPLAEGALTSGGLIVQTPAGVALPTQWNPLATWRTNGSVQHGAITFQMPAGGGSGTYRIRNGTPVAGTAITKANVDAAGVDASVSVNVAGTVYSLNLADLLDGAVTPLLDYTHFAGSLCSEFVLGGNLRAGGTPHADLQAYFHVRAYGNPVTRAYITVILENTNDFSSIASIYGTTTDVRIGGVSLPGFPKTNFAVHADIHYIKRGWWGSSPAVHATVTGDYAASTRMVPRYKPMTISASILDAYPQSAEWNVRQILADSNLAGAGGRPELAPFDRWTAAYLITGDIRAWNAMRAAQDEIAQVVHTLTECVLRSRDGTTGWPFDLTQKNVYSNVSGNQGGTPGRLSASRDGWDVAVTDLAHMPSVGYAAYLLTAESAELVKLLHSGVAYLFNDAPGGRPGLIPGRTLRFGQTRAVAWGLRELTNASAVCPDAHPLKAALDATMVYLLDAYAADMIPRSPLGVMLNGAIEYDNNGIDNAVSTWQNDWLTWAIAHAYLTGYRPELQANGLLNYFGFGNVSRFGTVSPGGWCWYNAAMYSAPVRTGAGQPFFTTWAEAAAHAGITSCPAVGGAFDRDTSAAYYGAQLGVSLAYLRDIGIAGAAAAWNIYKNRPFTYDQSLAPEWAVTEL